MENKVLYLSLKKEWFDMIKSGIKTEEYREVKEYWKKRLFSHKYDFVEFMLGYPKSNDLEKRIRFKIISIKIGYGIEEFGAELHKIYYVIKFGDKIKMGG